MAKRFNAKEYARKRNELAKKQNVWTVRDTDQEWRDYYNNWSK